MHENSPENWAPQVESFVKAEETITNKEVPSTIENLDPFLLETSQEIKKISGTWNPVELYTPSSESMLHEKSQFLTAWERGQRYNPEFEYPVAEGFEIHQNLDQLEHLKHALLRFRPKNHLEKLGRRALYGKLQDDLATVHLVEGMQKKDEREIRDAFRTKYPGLDPYLTAVAHTWYQKDCLPEEVSQEHTEAQLSSAEQEYLKEITFNAPQIKEAFEWSLEEYGLLKSSSGKGFEVTISPHATSIDVRDKSLSGPTIFIPETREMNGQKLLELIAHEIEAHVRQSMNGVDLFQIGGGQLKIDDETLYEGLAMHNEEEFLKKMFGKVAVAPPFYYALAVERADKGGSFYDVFEDQLEVQLHRALKIPPADDLPSFNTIEKNVFEKAKNEAWRVSCRVMRGHTDMNNPYGFAMTKDLAYLRGALLDKQLREAHYGFINEAAIIATNSLNLLAQYEVHPDDLPYPYKHVAEKYWEEVLKPDYLRKQLETS
jgi:hypothetical protein